MASPNFQVTINADPTMAMQGMQAMQQTQVGGYTAAPGMIQQPPEGKAPVRIHFDTSYIRTTPGIIKCLEIVNNIIGMICIMVSGCSWCSNSNWFNFVASTGLTVTGLLLLCYLVHIIERLKFVPWLAIELLYCATWTLFYMIAALVVAVKGGRDDAWAAAGVADVAELQQQHLLPQVIWKEIKKIANKSIEAGCMLQ
ncbi:CKLF-like MARVEL transmembrane domain-containing protein 4 [Trichonephila clavata]|uniref:CKLF-like MARVEL transmembrane domain-containing protein 4 n=1 Tax=Trichonephila clavata TaxID=2740835 RepID=A0A8X6J0D9_TRICU|nr:CKLF-like MARVEL transmembrane domain-containing protein 4 [Trichonephila clavata]